MSKKSILVVEDNDDSRNAMVVMIESFGYIVRPFASGEAALAEIREDAKNGRKLDLALLDIMMPGMDGYEVLVEIKKIDQYKTLPCVMVTAKDADSEVIEGYKYGADYYITKPFTAKQLKYGIELYL
jgi:two-component system phosphate regulon response regulator PhoB